MNATLKVLLLECWFFVGMPVLGGFLLMRFGLVGVFLYFLLLAVWCWELFAFCHYRFCRQEEFLHVLHTAVAVQAPLVPVLKAHLGDRPHSGLYRFWVGSLLFFVFPGYYWVHRERTFDRRIAQVVHDLEHGVSLDRALDDAPGLVTRQTALAVTAGQFTGRLAHALHQLAGRRSAPLWLELVARLAYPLLLLCGLLGNVIFMMTYIIPKYEKIFADFKLKLPALTQDFIGIGRWLADHSWAVPAVWLSLLAAVNVVVFSSRARWHFPLLGRLYRLHARGQFLQLLGMMLETDKPLPEILACAIESGLLPGAVRRRAEYLAQDLQQGQPLTDSLVKHGLAPEAMRALIAAAEKARNLPWALQELGTALAQRSARLTYRMTMVLFPLTIFVCACLIAFVAVSMFLPLVALIEGTHG